LDGLGLDSFLGVIMLAYTNENRERLTSGLLSRISRGDRFDLDQEAMMKLAAWDYCACGAILPENS
jgi:hypothetical protein